MQSRYLLPLLAAALTQAAHAQAPASGRFSNAIRATPAVEVPATINRAAIEAGSAITVADPNAAAPVERLRRGQTLYVRALDPNLEQRAKDAVDKQVAEAPPPDAAVETTVQSFEGIVRQQPMDSVDDEDELALKPYVLVGQPLQYRKDIARYVGTIHVGVADLNGGGRSRMLTSPLDFEVLETALADPAKFVITMTSPPYQPITINSDVTGAVARVRVASNFDFAGITVEVPVEPTLRVSIDGDDLRAFGIQTARISVTAIGGSVPPTGSPILSVSGAASAFLEDDAPVFDSAGRARTTLRTDGVGEVIVRAEYPNYAPGEDSVTVIWPLFTLGAASLGGLVGGLLRLAPRLPNRITGSKLVIGLFTSVLLGVFVFALYVVGVKVLPVDFGVQTGDIFAFACAALAGWLGSGVLPQVTPAAAPRAD